jgi:hypothetical protein
VALRALGVLEVDPVVSLVEGLPVEVADWVVLVTETSWATAKENPAEAQSKKVESMAKGIGGRGGSRM